MPKSFQIYFASLSILLGLLASPANCVADKNQLIAKDNNSEIQLPTSWGALEGLNALASLQAGNPTSNQYLIVVTEPKQELKEVDLENFSATAVDIILKNLSNKQLSAPKEITLGGLRGIRREISGSVQNVDVRYIHTSVEGTDNYFQVLVWCLEHEFPKYKSVLLEAVDSFRERNSP